MSIKDLVSTLWEMFMGPDSVPLLDETDSVTATTPVEQFLTYGASTSYSARDDPSVSTVAKAEYDWYNWLHAPTVNPAHLSNAFEGGHAAGSAFSTSSSLGYIDMAPKYDDDFERFPTNPYDVAQESKYQHDFWAKHCPESETLFVRRSTRIAAHRNPSSEASISPRGSVYFT